MFLSKSAVPYSNIYSRVPNAVDCVYRLSVEEQIELLCVLCNSVRERIKPSNSVQSLHSEPVSRLASQIIRLSSDKQFSALKTLIAERDTPLRRSYGALSSSGKLAFWCRLSELIQDQHIIPELCLDALSPGATAALTKIESLELNQQIAVLHLVLGRMGMYPSEN